MALRDLRLTVFPWLNAAESFACGLYSTQLNPGRNSAALGLGSQKLQLPCPLAEPRVKTCRQRRVAALRRRRVAELRLEQPRRAARRQELVDVRAKVVELLVVGVAVGEDGVAHATAAVGVCGGQPVVERTSRPRWLTCKARVLVVRSTSSDKF